MKTSDKFQEILRLDRLLTDAGIPHEIAPDLDGWHIGYPVLAPRKRVVSVVEFRGTYGNEQDKLESMGLLTPAELKRDGVVGWLDAQNVFMRISEHYERTKKEATP